MLTSKMLGDKGFALFDKDKQLILFFPYIDISNMNFNVIISFLVSYVSGQKRMHIDRKKVVYLIVIKTFVYIPCVDSSV